MTASLTRLMAATRIAGNAHPGETSSVRDASLGPGGRVLSNRDMRVYVRLRNDGQGVRLRLELVLESRGRLIASAGAVELVEEWGGTSAERIR